MSASLNIHRNAFHLNLDTTREILPLGLTIHEVLVMRKLLVDGPDGYVRVAPFIVTINGEAVLQAHWNTIINADDVMQVVYMPKGGGGSNMGGILAGILAAVMAYFTFGASLMVTVAVGAAVAVGMTLLMSAVAPPPTRTPGLSEATSSTYDLSAQGNRARLGEAMPRVYGTMRTFPDLATQSYSEYESNQQVLYQLFCVSLGDVDIDEMLLDETPIANFTDAKYEIIKPGGAVTLFPDNVLVMEAVSNLELLAPDSPDYRPPIAYVISNTIEVNQIAVDIGLPRGLGQIDKNPKGSGATLAQTVQVVVEYARIDSGQWTNMGVQAFTFATAQPQAMTFKVDVPLGLYQVRAYRITGTRDTGTFDTVQWVACRGYAPSTHVYGDCTLIATVMRATNALNSTIARKFAVISTSKLQPWDPVNGWGAAVRTQSIAWIAADIIRNTEYGRGLATTRFNVQNLYRLDGVWTSRGDYFNGVFDTTTQMWEALKTVLRVGRTTPIYYAATIDFVREEPQTVVTAQFTPATMVKGSFSTSYQFYDSESPDHVLVEYIDIDKGWVSQEVPCFLPDSPMRNPVKLSLAKGCTNRDQAWREGISMIASNRYRRRTIQFTTLKGGMIPSFNALVRISHDVPEWGYSGKVLSFTPSNGRMRTTEPVPFDQGGTYMVAFRKRNGSEHGPFTIVEDTTLGEDQYGFLVQGTTQELSTIYISNGVKEDYTIYTAGPSTRRGILGLVQSAKPDDQGRTQIVCINVSDAVHTAELNGEIPAPPPESNLPSLEAAPIIDTVDVVYTTEVGVQNVIATVSRNAIYYQFEARISGGGWQRLGNQDVPRMQVNLAPGQWEVRVRGIGRVEGPWTTWSGTIEATTLPTARLTAFVATSKLWAIGLNVAYDPLSNSIARTLEIWAHIEPVLGNATRLVELPFPASGYDHINLSAGDRWYYWARVIDTAGRVGPWYNNGVAITQIASIDLAMGDLTGKIGKSQLNQELQEEIASGGGGSTEIKEIQDQLAALITLKSQVKRPDGTPVIAGVGIGVEDEEGELISQILLMASRIAFINGNNPATDELVYPLIVENGQVFVNDLIVKKATILNALIGAKLESVNKDSQGRPFLSLDFQTGEEISRSEGDGYRTERAPSYNRIFNNVIAAPVVEMGVLWKAP